LVELLVDGDDLGLSSTEGAATPAAELANTGAADDDDDEEAI